ncbi:4-hydroxythreonine-4-phosphate dehydrogenase [Cyanobium sp. Cruz CV13-4-11]|jgi:hypothetical protein|uniref:4-hydroxythreonine-4-phosphate dehydrogenase n=1 Tax=unclassified Cyanobium TaxID=2627006 RepID=UPI0020CC2838|nr:MULTISPECIES: 4-hydroxythreonine-4-phosphate dehydrogenase [unclassified Cyanobium]MCP9902232.1 4-hydroxythreonine-4-phosphate dehydrogenase [Cyanobium sp. Cruz CV11-17]MCP9921103.1 4-hydroxythreonine-4-phosphate dehydrogenase [Cyanobium sp. Cruz CV13-4-11]
MIRLLLLGALLLGGGVAFRNEWVVVDWQKIGKDTGVSSMIDPSIFGSQKKSPLQDDNPSR